MIEAKLQTEAQIHVALCRQCWAHLGQYTPQVRDVLAGAPLPDELATKLRAGLCPKGARLFDALVCKPAAVPS